MIMHNIYERLREIVFEKILVDKQSIVPEARFLEDLGVDSLDMLELVDAIEQAFEIEIPEGNIKNFDTVGRLCDFIEQNVKQKQA